MPQINLKARLQAYSRAPFYGDYIRLPSGILEETYDPNIAYVLKDGNWIDLVKASSDTGLSINELRDKIAQVELQLLEDVRTVRCYVDYARQGIIFVDSNGLEYFYILPAAATDQVTIGINQDNKITLLDKPDQKSIKVVDVVYDEDPILGVGLKLSGTLRADGLYIKEDPTLGMLPEAITEYKSNYISGYDLHQKLNKLEKNVQDIESYVQGTGGFLDPHNFGQALTNIFDINKNNILNQYAYDQLFNGQAQQIPDLTKVKNTYTGNIWVYIQEKSTWINEGKDTIVTATNDGVLGAVTGVEYNIYDASTKFKISINKDDKGFSDGTMSVNGLEAEFAKVLYKTEADADSAAPETYVLRTSSGTIVANPSMSDNEVITQGLLNDWFSGFALSDAAIQEIVDLNFIPMHNDGGIN